MVKVIEVNSGDVGDQVAMASPGTPSTVQGRIIDVPGAPSAPQSWADTLAVNANSGPVSPVLDVPIEAALGTEFRANSPIGARLQVNGLTVLYLTSASNQPTAQNGSVLTRGIGSGSPARWIQPLYFTATYFIAIADSSAQGTVTPLLVNNAYSLGPFLSAGNMSAIGVTAALPGASPGVPLTAAQAVTVDVFKNGAPWLTVVCSGNNSRQFWSLEGSLSTANQFAAADIITAQVTLTTWPGGGGATRPRVTVMLGLRVGGV